jgi:hypothetical protein
MPSSASQQEERLVLCGPSPDDEEGSAWDLLQDVIDIVPSRSADFAFLRTRLQPDDAAASGEMPIGQRVIRTAGPGGAELWEFPVCLDPLGLYWFDSYLGKLPVLKFTVLVESSSATGKWWTVWLHSARDVQKLAAVLRRLAPHIKVVPDLRAVPAHVPPEVQS